MVDAAVRAGIDLQGSTLRYAEIEQYGSRYRLLRLGSCDFDFDVAEELLHREHSEHLATVSDALVDIFAGSVASHLHIAVHPPDCYSFFAPLPIYMSRADRARRLKQEADILIETPLDAPVHLHEESLFTEAVDSEHVEWFHVLGLPEHAGTQLDRILEAAPQRAYRPRLSMRGAATAALRIIAREPADDAAITLAFGLYPNYTEYTVCRGAHWRFSRYGPAGPPSDTAYFALVLLRHLGLPPEEVKRVFVYYNDEGTDDRFDILDDVFGVSPEPLDALLALDIDRESLKARFSAEAYVPCIGAAL